MLLLQMLAAPCGQRKLILRHELRLAHKPCFICLFRLGLENVGFGLGRDDNVEIWRDVVRVANPRWNTLLRTAEQQQLYMELTPLLFYLGAMILRQAKCTIVCSEETRAEVKQFREKLSKMAVNDSKLYTPTLSNYGRLQDVVFSLQQNCSRSTLMCFEEEMKVLDQETEAKTDLPRKLKKLKQRLTDKINPCPQCEVYKEEAAEIFLDTLLTVLQIICSSSP